MTYTVVEDGYGQRDLPIHPGVVQEYDELGADEFLSRHGYAPARIYRVAEHGRGSAKRVTGGGGQP
jgi:hypothetical protein